MNAERWLIGCVCLFLAGWVCGLLSHHLDGVLATAARFGAVSFNVFGIFAVVQSLGADG